MKIRFLLAALILSVSAMVACGGGEAVKADEAVTGAETKVEETGPVLANDGTRQVGDRTTCAVSGDAFTIKADSPKTEHEGKTYYFCCAGCVDKFTADPAKFLTDASAPAADAPAADAPAADAPADAPAADAPADAPAEPAAPAATEG